MQFPTLRLRNYLLLVGLNLTLYVRGRGPSPSSLFFLLNNGCNQHSMKWNKKGRVREGEPLPP